MSEGLKKTGKIALVIITPTVIVIIVLIALWGWKKYKAKQALKTGTTEINIAGMKKYRFEIPLSYQKELFTDGNFFEAIKNLNYVFIDEYVEGNVIYVNVLFKPEDFNKAQEIVDALKSEIKIKEIKPN